jgi:hypothetical protein
MKNTIVALTLAALWIPAAADAQTRTSSVVGFGGMTFGTTAVDSAFGGGIAVSLGDHVQLIGEVGRIRNVMPSTLDTVFDLLPIGLRTSALTGEGGVRFLSGRGPVRGYVEGTAGAARLSTRLSGATGIADAAVNAGLQFLDTTQPLVGAGGGVILQGGPLVVDLGYRYKRILDTGPSLAALGGGSLDLSQVRVGVGFSF